MSQKFEIVGLMSGSSLDGLDVAFCEFSRNENSEWSGKIIDAQTFKFPSGFETTLRNLPKSTALDLVETDQTFIQFSAICTIKLCQKVGRKPMAIASHGHTIFHNPGKGYTTQIGNGGLLAGITDLPVISDFRTLDVGLGGQGAPLVPGAEKFLFLNYDACLNLGGIANVSFPRHAPFLGFDIAPCNQLLNQATNWIGLEYDEGGKIASSGHLIPDLLKELNEVNYYKKNPPKSLGNEDVANFWKPIVDKWKSQPENVMHTLTLHIADQISKSVLAIQPKGKLLTTGGGAFHSFLIEEIKKAFSENWKIEVPESQMVSFKEAYCFAFLGLKRLLNETNCFAEVTGANSDSSLGAVYNGNQLDFNIFRC